MKLSQLGEFGLIRHIRNSSRSRSVRVRIGIGDDAAVLKQTPSESLLATADMLVEGVHFDLAYTDFYSLGWKSAAVNLSDIAAMGGLPRFCLTSLGIPPAVTPEQLAEFYRGIHAVLKQHKTALVGGDTCATPEGFVISVTVLGETAGRRMLTRSGAKPGDRIFVTGPLGDSAAGLELLQRGRKAENPAERALIRKHLRPVPRVAWGGKIAQSRSAHALIDISDGLSSDLGHVCEESGVGAVIEETSIPLSSPLRKVSPALKKTPLDYALNGGEEYELLFTAPAAHRVRLQSLGIPLYEIGKITRNRSRLIVGAEGTARVLKPGGYDHFQRSRTRPSSKR